MNELRILGNCQVGGIAESISLLVEGVKVHGEFAPSNIAELGSVLNQHIEYQGSSSHLQWSVVANNNTGHIFVIFKGGD